jgi:hypothetical protein
MNELENSMVRFSKSQKKRCFELLRYTHTIQTRSSLGEKNTSFLQTGKERFFVRFHILFEFSQPLLAFKFF